MFLEVLEAMTKLLAMKVCMSLIFSAWVLVWILRPTKVWNKAWHHVEKSTNSPAYGRAGADILVFSFPLILLAILSAVYMSLKRSQVTKPRRNGREFSGFPVFIRGPFGFVSLKELILLLIFLGLMIWTFSTYLVNDFSKITPKQLKKSGNHLIWQYKLERVGIRLGYTGQLCLALLFLPVSRGLPLLQMLGIHFELSVKYHIWLATTTILLYTLHSLCFIIVWASQHKLQAESYRWDRIVSPGRANLAGLFALIVAKIILVTSINPIRRKYFEIFYYTHHLYVLFMVFFLMHIVDRHSTLVLAGIFLFLCDRFLRFIQSRRAVQIHSAKILPCRAIELTLSKHPSLMYSSTSIVFLKIPVVSHMQWHPFTITSSPSVSDSRISVLIKCQGSWSQKLYDIVTDPQSQGNNVKLSAALEGPYGPSDNYFLRYDSLILIAGGSGITPFLSILQCIFSRASNTKILLVYAVKKKGDLSMLSLLPPSLLQEGLSGGLLKFQAYITQEQGPLDPELLKVPSEGIKTLHYKINENYAPILMGLESNLVKASMICLSFIFFILILGIFNGFIVHPNDEKAKNGVPSWARALLMVVAALVGISMSGFVVVLSQWKTWNGHVDNGKYSSKSLEALDDRVWESLDLLRRHGIIHHHRPNFRDIMFKNIKANEASQIGVLVCGPTDMQEDVACSCHSLSLICETNFTFHPISFSI